MASEEHQPSFYGKEFNMVGIKDLPKAERPRERLLLVGSASLSLSELLSVILGQGAPQMPVTEVSNKLLAKFGGLDGLCRVSIEDLLSVDGIGFAKATRLYASFELARRFSGGVVVKSKSYQNSKMIYNLLKPYLLHKKREHFVVVSVDVRYKLIAVDNVSIGTLSESIVHPREVFKTAINRNASAIFIAHNHPSGDCDPSDADVMVTKRLVKTSYTIGIPIIDHIIMSDSSYLSMKEKGLLSDFV